LYTLFTAFGEVEDVTIHTNRRTGRHWGLVYMADRDEAQRAIDELDGLPWRGKTLRMSVRELSGRK
jgi:RNA recognition motif-containing protein